MENTKIKSKIKSFLESQVLCVVSSIDGSGKPQSATVGFSEDQELNLVFGTSIKSRKAQNIINNPNVSIVIVADSSIRETVQIEGQAHILEGEELEKYQKIHFNKLPSTEKYKNDLDECWVMIKPSWARFSHVDSYPRDVKELNF
mgnify:FL=1